MRFKTRMVGLATVALLAGAPTAVASTASLRDGTTVVYTGDAAGDTVTLSRDEGTSSYLVSDGDRRSRACASRPTARAGACSAAARRSS